MSDRPRSLSLAIQLATVALKLDAFIWELERRYRISRVHRRAHRSADDGYETEAVGQAIGESEPQWLAA